MNRRPPPTSASQPWRSALAPASSSSSSAPSSARQGAWFWVFLRNRDMAQLTEGVQGPDHLLPALDGLAADVHHPVDGGLGDIRDRLDDVVVDRSDRILAPIVRPAGDLRAVLAAEVAGAERDAGAREAADARRGDADR